MEQITLGNIAAWAGFIALLGGSIVTILKGAKKILTELFTEQMKQINARLDQQEETIKKIDQENCKNFLVSFLAKAESGGTLDEIETQRFWEEYQHYEKQGGNSYIHRKVEQLKADKKL